VSDQDDAKIVWELGIGMADVTRDARWLLTAHPLPPLLFLPPIALLMTVSSALFAYLVLMCCFKPIRPTPSGSSLNPSDKVGYRSTNQSSIPPPPYREALPAYPQSHDPVPRIAIVSPPNSDVSSSTAEGFDAPRLRPAAGQQVLDSEDGTMETGSETRSASGTTGTEGSVNWSDAGEGEGTPTMSRTESEAD
jgi:hypothetical protein